MSNERIQKNKFLSAVRIAVTVILIGSCSSEEHFITDNTLRDIVSEDFQEVVDESGARKESILSVVNSEISMKEKEALMFLYAYMPLNDIADYTPEFFLKNVQLAFEAQKSFSWGAEIPEATFRHFVLPHRVNNENLDTARGVFLNEIRPRLEGMNIEEAALEVNHWCHEKVNYQPTDSRTICPLGAVKTAYGRCGEESTFTVTALRSVGIPARQVYTPRWAHVDDNHAWVEVYVNGTWKYLGACEPEPELNMGWFSAPVLRAMMVHTKAFGKYLAVNDDVVEPNYKYTVLNTLKYYAPTKEIYVKVVDTKNQPVKDALIEFGLYNYAEYYPIKKIESAWNGEAKLKTGLGDLRIFASDKKTKFQIQKISVIDVDTVTINLERTVGDEFTEIFENVPPVERAIPPGRDKGAAENKIRFAREDSIRNAFIATFYTEEKAFALAKEFNLDKDRVWKVMKESRGNYPEIEDYLIKGVEINKGLALELLEVIATKDLHDATASTLLDHLSNHHLYSGEDFDDQLVLDYILNPRIHLEALTPYRKFLKEQFAPTVDGLSANESIKVIVDWIKQNLSIDNESNYYRIAISPKGSFDVKRTDEFSRKLFFVAVSRSIGIPARLEPATLKAQYYSNGWINVDFEQQEQFVNPDLVKTVLTNNPENPVKPLYRIHFSIAKFQDGRFQTLHYGWEKPLNEVAENLELEPGYYQILTGNRLDNGTVLVSQEFLNIEKGTLPEIVIDVEKNQEKARVIANWENNLSVENLKVIGWLNPDTEPGKHFLNDFQALKSTFQEKVDMNIYCENKKFIDAVSSQIPENYPIQIDEGLEILNSLYEETDIGNLNELPVFIVIDAQGDIYYHTSGYNIGTSEQLLKIYNRVKSQN